MVLGCGSVEQGEVTLAVEPASVFFRRGETAMVQVTAADAKKAVAITATGLPPGVTADALELDGAAPGTLVLHADATATQGAANITVEADVGGTAGFRVLVGGPPGTLDESFGDGGKIVTTLPGVALVGRGLSLDGSNVIVTGVNTGQGQSVTMKFDERGQPDASFGTNGIVSTGVGMFSEGLAIVATASNLVVAGVANGNAVDDDDFGLFGYTRDGVLDTTFGASGVTTINPSTGTFAEYHAVVAAPDGTIYAVGPVFGSSTLSIAHKFSSHGITDPAFSVSESGAVAQSAVLQADGKLVLGGVQSSQMWLARYNPDGTRDPGFGSGGIVTTSFAPESVGGTGFGLVQVAGGKLFAVSTTVTNPRIILARYNANGSLDLTFGIGGKITTDVVFSSRSLGAAVIDGDGRVVTVGLANMQPAIARVNADGTADATFATAGIAAIDFGVAGTNTKTGAYGVVADPDGRLLFTGEVGAAGSQRLIVARVWP